MSRQLPKQSTMTCRREACSHWRNCDSISQQHCTRSWKNLVRLWRAQKLCDLVFVVEDEKFLCHGIVPATTSAFIRRVFLKRIEMSVASTMLEEKEIIIDFIEKDIFAQVLNFMYTAEVDVTTTKLKRLFRAGAKLEMQGLVDAIMRNVLDKELERDRKRDSVKKSRPKNMKPPGAAKRRPVPDESDDSDDEESPFGLEFVSVCGLIDDLRLQGEMSTLGLALGFAARNFGQICKTRGFLRASVHTVAALLDDDRLNMEEFLVFQALTKWLEAAQMHLVHGPYLLSKVRLQLLTPEELTDHVESKDYLMRKKKSRVMILEAFRYHCLKSSDETDKSLLRQQERTGKFSKLDSDGEDWTIEGDGKLIREDRMATYCPIKPCSCCPNYIITSGGIDVKDAAPSEGLYKYEERDNRWTRFAKQQHPRNHHAAVYCKGYLYVLGGSDPTLTGKGSEVCPVATCYRLGLESLTWTKIDPMSTPRMSMQAVYLNGYIYAIGGQDHKQRILRDIERYSVTDCVWEYAGALSSVRAGTAVCVHKQKIWIAGGYSHKRAEVSDVVEEFDDEFESWQDMCPLRFPRCFASLADCLGGLYIVGGAWLDSGMDCGNFSSVFDVDKFNDLSNVWEGVTALRVGRHDCGCAVLGPRIYIVGGKHCDDGSINSLDSVECFDVEKSDWIEGVNPLPIPLLGTAVTFTT